MSTVERIERAEQRRGRRAFLLFAALTILALGLVGRSWFVDPIEGGTDVLSQVQERFGLQALIGQRRTIASGTGEAVTATDGWAAGAPTTSADGGGAATSVGDDGGSPTPARATNGEGRAPGDLGEDRSRGTTGGADRASDGGVGSPRRGAADPGVGTGGGPGATPPAPPQTFGVRGDLSDLYPGFVGELDLTLTNPHRFRIVVTDLTVQVGTPTLRGAPVPACAGMLTVTPWRGNRVVGARGSTSQQVTARFSVDATDACQDVSYPLRYGGTALRESRT